jgi:hypothetical protein
MNGNDGAFVSAAPDGSFSVEHLAPGPYTIDGYDLVTHTTIERPGDTATATLRAPDSPGQIAGTLTGNLPATPGIIPLQVTAFPRDAQGYDFGTWTYTTDVSANSHSFRLRNLPPGTYGLLATAMTNRAEFSPTLWLPNIEVRASLSRELTIDIPKGRLVLLNTDAAPDLKRWRLRMPTGDWLDSTLFTRNRLTGTFELPPGDYQLAADFGAAEPSLQSFTVTPGPTTQPVVLHNPKK